MEGLDTNQDGNGNKCDETKSLMSRNIVVPVPFTLSLPDLKSNSPYCPPYSSHDVC